MMTPKKPRYKTTSTTKTITDLMLAMTTDPRMMVRTPSATCTGPAGRTASTEFLKETISYYKNVSYIQWNFY